MALEGPGTVVLCQVLSGSGGVGKTQVAAHYARACWSSGAVDSLVWLTASNRESIVAQYAHAAAMLMRPESVPADPEEAAQSFLAWLASIERSWLVVLDDLADPGDLKGLWPPQHATGRTVVTTRRRDAALGGAGRRRVDVDVFTQSEAVTYITAKLAAHGREDDPGQIRALAQELGNLPIALAQALAYLLDVDLDCAGYRARWTDRRRTLARLVPQDTALPDDQRAGLAAVWSLSVQRANALEPVGLAGPMLELASLLDPNGIPLDVLTAPPARRYAAERRSPRAVWDVDSSDGAVEADDGRDALTALARLSLCTIDPRNPHRAVRVHALVQRAVRESLTPQQRNDAAHAAADALLHAWPEVDRDGALSLSLRGNTENLNDNARDALWEPDSHAALLRAGGSLGQSGLVAEAAAYFDRLHRQAVARLGPDHPDTLSIRSNLAIWWGEAGDVAGAVTAFEELLADLLRVLGPDHPHTLSTRGNLARYKGDAGDVAGAAAAFEGLLVDRLRVLGPDHPDTLSTRNNLATWRGTAGDAAGAVTAFEELLADLLRVLGPDHPQTLLTRGNLATWRGRAGDVAGAAAAFERLLVDHLRVLGPDHPHTLITCNNLAAWRGRAGDVAGAATATEELLVDRLRVLGPDHPDTLSTRNNLAYWRGEAGDAAGAATATEELLADRLRLLGPHHPDTLLTRGNLASWRGEAGDAAGAATATEELLADRLHVLGPDHPDTLSTRSNLATWRGRAGDAAGAAAAFEELLADRLRVLGPDHPHTLITRNNLTTWRDVSERDRGKS